MESNFFSNFQGIIHKLRSDLRDGKMALVFDVNCRGFLGLSVLVVGVVVVYFRQGNKNRQEETRRENWVRNTRVESDFFPVVLTQSLGNHREIYS